ncbi:hypothetical protein C1H46_000425 [Malus baccata]|uniref:Uncharacterized protein n=1 Tax=Malus baccata TaxID=106549 RepID=A0A540NTM4_MALBA|nr:hypothetical protein C1H46_000425 [Malus baccata]
MGNWEGENCNWKMGTLRELGSEEGKVWMVVESTKKIHVVEMADLGEEEVTMWDCPNWEIGFWSELLKTGVKWVMRQEMSSNLSHWCICSIPSRMALETSRALTLRSK